MIQRFIIGGLTFKRLMFSAIEIYLILLVFAWFFADWIIHHPPARNSNPLLGEISLTTSDGIRLSAVWLPNPKATCTILFSHGNAEDLRRDLPYLQELRNAGFNVFGYDYRGYGRSEGKPSEHGLYRDIEAAYDYLVGPLRIAPARILVHGRSIGSGPSVYLVTKKPAAGLILESAFTSAFRVPIPFRLFPFDQFPNLKRLSQIYCPILFIHGTRDSIIPIRHGKKLYESYRGPKEFLWVEGADHNDLFATDPDGYLQAIRDFAQHVTK